jgi:transcriptional regulator with XRE-family HTH domain
MTKAASRVGSNIRHYRRVVKLTQSQAAQACGVPLRTWARIESGNANPTLSTLEAVAFTLNLPLNSLFTALWPNIEA